MRRNLPPKAVRVMVGQLAAHEKWAQLDDEGRRAATEAGRQANLGRWDQLARQQHPDATDAEVNRIANNMRSAHYLRMALKSHQARSQKRGGGGA